MPENIDISNYDYDLIEQRIAKHPLPERDRSLLLQYKNSIISQSRFSSLPDILDNSDMLVFNDTRVIQARLVFRKSTGAKIELFCLEPVDPVDYQISFQQSSSCIWRCMVGNAKKWKQDDLFMGVIIGQNRTTLNARQIKKELNTFIIEFHWENSHITFAEIIEYAGFTPIPPYLNRASEPDDRVRYQTVYSQYNGSVAAPTAGLHFTDSVLEKLRNKGIQMDNLTLHIGAGTFTPVKENDATKHTMHSETVLVERKFIEQLLHHSGRVIAVGTTSTRSLESLYWLGVKALNANLDRENIVLSQWEVYDMDQEVSNSESLENLLTFMDQNNLDQLHFQTRIMVIPGYRFRLVNVLITNFHQPKSTLLLLIAAFIGEKWQKVYEYAIKNEFRFLSYGDSSILFPSEV